MRTAPQRERFDPPKVRRGFASRSQNVRHATARAISLSQSDVPVHTSPRARVRTRFCVRVRACLHARLRACDRLRTRVPCDAARCDTMCVPRSMLAPLLPWVLGNHFNHPHHYQITEQTCCKRPRLGQHILFAAWSIMMHVRGALLLELSVAAQTV